MEECIYPTTGPALACPNLLSGIHCKGANSVSDACAQYSVESAILTGAAGAAEIVASTCGPGICHGVSWVHALDRTYERTLHQGLPIVIDPKQEGEESKSGDEHDSAISWSRRVSRHHKAGRDGRRRNQALNQEQSPQCGLLKPMRLAQNDGI